MTTRIRSAYAAAFALARDKLREFPNSDLLAYHAAGMLMGVLELQPEDDSPERRAQEAEVTALGAAYLAGLATGVWQSEEELSQLWKCETAFQPEMAQAHRDQLMANWHKAVGRSRDWAEK